MAEDESSPVGFDYWVSDAQLEAFRSRSPSERLKWLEEMREFTVRVAPPHAQASWRRLRAHR
jgi:hypothetical protein